MPTDLIAHRQFYARLVTARAGVTDARIIEAFATVERERFLGPGPWYVKAAAEGYVDTGTDDPAVLYQDVVVGLMPDRGINNGEPSLHAKSIGAASPAVGEIVVHVGAGTGYYTAILACLVGERGCVNAYEVEGQLAQRAKTNLTIYPQVSVRETSALNGSLPAANVIYVSAGATHVPLAWLDALLLGGRLVVPLTPDRRLGCMLLVRRVSGSGYSARVFSTAGFVPCLGARDETSSERLADALDRDEGRSIRSLRLGDSPDATVWCRGEGWWLSTADPVS